MSMMAYQGRNGGWNIHEFCWICRICVLLFFDGYAGLVHRGCVGLMSRVGILMIK